MGKVRREERGGLRDAVVETVEQLHLPCMSTTGSGAETLKMRGGFHTTSLSQSAYFPKTTMIALLSHASELLGSVDLAPGLSGLQIISLTEPSTYEPIGLPRTLLFLKFPGCVPLVCFKHIDRILRGGC